MRWLGNAEQLGSENTARLVEQYEDTGRDMQLLTSVDAMIPGQTNSMQRPLLVGPALAFH